MGGSWSETRAVRLKEPYSQLFVLLAGSIATDATLTRARAQAQARKQIIHFMCTVGEQGENPALESLFQRPHPGLSHRDCTGTQCQIPGLAVTVAVPTVSIHRLAPLGLEAAQQSGHFLLQHVLSYSLNESSGPSVQVIPNDA